MGKSDETGVTAKPWPTIPDYRMVESGWWKEVSGFQRANRQPKCNRRFRSVWDMSTQLICPALPCTGGIRPYFPQPEDRE